MTDPDQAVAVEHERETVRQALADAAEDLDRARKAVAELVALGDPEYATLAAERCNPGRED